jgi:hypothetical protein
MSKAELLITAVVVEGRSKSEVAREYGVSRYWVQTLVKRFETDGVAAYQPRSRRPHSSPQGVSADVEDQIIRLRKELSKQGLDAGAETIAAHLVRDAPRSAPESSDVPAVSTIWRILSRRGFVTRNRRNVRGPRGDTSARSSPTNAGRPIPPIGLWPTAPTWRSSTSSMTTPG